MSTTSRRNNEIFQKANKYCIAALISLSIALAVLSVGVFLTYPISVVGFLSTCIGIVCTDLGGVGGFVMILFVPVEEI